eukprot:TRINITY_DN5265_c0_g1_i1.p1 TRINITY_DN5265_c0_g1~~TRINITY_DN5265_c0_g1_i1.p1  ORF type:complete len:421 (+),score=103.87 TRINITY_DN5265_c0_g1_i1:172-1434(+)
MNSLATTVVAAALPQVRAAAAFAYEHRKAVACVSAAALATCAIMRRRRGRGRGSVVAKEPRMKPCKVLTKATGERYLVTGGSGFIGSHLVEALLARGDHNITIYDICEPRVAYDKEEGVTVVLGQLTDTRRLAQVLSERGITVVFHVASLVNFWSRLPYDYQQSYQANVVGTESVIAACKQAHVKKLISTSSVAVTFNDNTIVNMGLIDESTPYATNPINHYAATKILAEKAVLAANGQDGVLTACMRPETVFGPRDHVIAEMIATKPVTFFRNVSVKQEINYVENIVHGHLCLEQALQPDSVAAGQVYNVSDNHPTQMMEFYMKFASSVGKRPLLLPASLICGLARVVEFVGRLSRGRLVPDLLKIVTPSAMAMALGSFWIVCDKAKRDLGYEPPYTQDEGIELCRQFYENRKKLLKQN